MKVALFSDTFLPQINGVTNTITKIIEHFEKNNIEYIVFAPESYKDNNHNFNVETFLSVKFFLYPECRISFPNTFKLRNSLLKFKPDIIHTMTEFNMGIAGMNYGKRYNIPIVSSYTTNFAKYLKYYNLDFIESYCWDYMRWFHGQSYKTVCPSEETMKFLYDNGIKNTAIFSRGVDSERFNSKHRSKKLREGLGIDNKIVLLYVGRIAPEKDIHVLLKSYNQLISRYRDKIALIITGDGPELERYKESFPKGTIFTGYKKGHELAEIYASSDIFVFPSPTETFGNVVLEAMTSGLPVIVPNSGGVKDIVKDRINGLMFEPGDFNNLTSLISEIIENTTLREKLCLNSRKTGVERSWKSIIDELIVIYEEAIYNNQQNYNKIV